MAPKYPLGTKSANGAYAIGKNGHTLPLEYIPYLGVGLRENSSWKTTSGTGGGGGGSSSGSSGGSGFTVPPQQPGQSFAWQFPQYSQTWAFTPPAPSAFRLPPAFDPKTSTGYAAPPKTTTAKNTTTPFSITDLFGKY
jgi:hypothetical protein